MAETRRHVEPVKRTQLTAHNCQVAGASSKTPDTAISLVKAKCVFSFSWTLQVAGLTWPGILSGGSPPAQALVDRLG